MKLVASLTLVIAVVSGQSVDGTNVFRYYGSCFSTACPLEGQECCNFEAGKKVKGKFCMTEEQKIDP